MISRADQAGVVEEFFELFKTPWEFYRPRGVYDIVVATADVVPRVDAKLFVVYGPTDMSIDVQIGAVARSRQQRAVLSGGHGSLPIYGELLTFSEDSKGICCLKANLEIAGLTAGCSDSTVVRLGYDLFDEVRFLVKTGQPIEHAHIPSLDIHIQMLRSWILNAGLGLLEIPPVPAGHTCFVCLTHDIDFVGIRRHRLDHSAMGFLYRATIGATRNFARGRLSLAHLFRSWMSAMSLPFVYAGWARDFWEPFGWYLDVEKGLPATYFVIPFKGHAGENVPGPNASRRATAYDINDIAESIRVLLNCGCEVGVHGIDAWHSTAEGRKELTAVSRVSGESTLGVRIHWLLRDTDTQTVLEDAGYAYDSTFGYNDTVGYRAGTGQVFRPERAKHLLELPLHIQDGALFYPQKLDLSEPEAEQRCRALIDNAIEFGGVLTLLWHDRSHGPERFWGGFYVGLVHTLRSLDTWFGTAAQVVNWFRQRRHVRFDRVEGRGGARIRILYDGGEIRPPLKVRVYCPASERDGIQSVAAFVDVPWDGKSADELESQVASRASTSVLR